MGKSLPIIKKYSSNANYFAWLAPPIEMRRWDGGAFSFMGITREVLGEGDWEHGDCPMLWRYNLHYLDDLDSLGNGPEQISLIRSWIRVNTRKGNISWDPYVISLRVVNIIKWVNRHNIQDPEIEASLWEQGQVLLKNIEYHLQANHLFANAKALVFLGAVFKGEFLEVGCNIFLKELSSQFFDDGGHYERSPMYQGILLRDLLDIYYLIKNLNLFTSSNAVGTLKDLIPRSYSWFQSLHHNDGEVSFFNDSAMAISPNLNFFSTYLDFLKCVNNRTVHNREGIAYYSSSGFFRWREGEILLLGDVGKPGPDIQPGHSHAETNSFEFSVGSKRVIVNSGISTYEVSPKRLSQRSTLLHSTVSVNGLNSSDVWSSFRLGKRIKNVNVIQRKSSISCTHDGFLVQGLDSLHKREWELTQDGVVVNDFLIGNDNQGEANFIFHPQFKLRKDGKCLFLESCVLSFKITLKGGVGRVSFGESSWANSFGLEENNTKLRVEFKKELTFRMEMVV